MASYDWFILEIDGVTAVIEQASRKVARHYDVDMDDLTQEARLLVANLETNLPECVAGIDPDLGLLQYRLEQDLVDKIKTDISRRNKAESYEDRYDTSGEGTYAPSMASTVVRQDVNGYTRELVESLIPAVWDESYCYGMVIENAPDHDMPRGSTNKATGGTLAAHIVDIKIGWERAPLSLSERRALLLGIGMDWSQKDIAFNLGVSQRSVSSWLYSGVGKIVATLNGNEALLDELALVDAA